MKKFFAFAAVALIAFSFASCNPNDPQGGGSNFFKINVTNIDFTTADLEIIPADTSVYYFPGMVIGEEGIKSMDSLINVQMKKLKGYDASDLIDAKILVKGTFKVTIEDMESNTDHAVFAFDVVINGENFEKGKEFTYKTFKTKAPENEDLGVLEGGGFEDYRDEDGSYLADAVKEGEYDVTLNIVDADFIGNFTEADLILEYSYIWTKNMHAQYGQDIVQAQLESKLAGEDAATISGWVIAANGAKYTFTFTHPTVEAKNAPKRAPKHNESKPAIKSLAK